MSEEMKTFKVVQEDVNDDGKEDLSFYIKGARTITVFDWRSEICKAALSAASFFVAGAGLIMYVW